MAKSASFVRGRQPQRDCVPLLAALYHTLPPGHPPILHLIRYDPVRDLAIPARIMKVDGQAKAMHAENDDLDLLRALCQSSDVALVRRACSALRTHPWTQQEHAVIFECCAALSACGVRIDSRRLAAQLTRAGFPDVNLDALFAPVPDPDRELARRVDALLKEKR